MEKCIEETKTLRKKGYSNPRNKAFCQGDYLWNERNEESDSLFHLAMNKKHVCQKMKKVRNFQIDYSCCITMSIMFRRKYISLYAMIKYIHLDKFINTQTMNYWIIEIIHTNKRWIQSCVEILRKWLLVQ